MAVLSHDGGGHATPAARLWRALQSRYLLGGGYAIAAFLAAVAILLAASPPETGPLAPASKNILVILGLNLVLILALAAQVGLRVAILLRARSTDPAARLQHYLAVFLRELQRGATVQAAERTRAACCCHLGG